MTPDPFIGAQFDEYRLDALLGKGNMARIYLATDVRLGRKAAIKVIRHGHHNDAQYLTRFEREARAIAQLNHPHIVQLYRFGQTEDVLYMAMQYIEGASLAVVLNSYRADGQYIEAQEALRLAREIGSALDYAHLKGVIHRDVKPPNIMLDITARAILTDFGLVLIKADGTRGGVLGTPHYLAPEQARSSANAGPTSDIYSLGVILYEMFTNTRPFDAARPVEVAMMHITQPPRPPSELRPAISPALEAVILKAMAKKQADRYQSGAALVAALDEALREGGLRPAMDTSAGPAPAGSIMSRTLAVPLAELYSDVETADLDAADDPASAGG
ncbi:MAG: serine/threonine protein kinase [Anaerolineae bacterium]|nr:serine/threonine protein kinase [Anaerolineae bacterium]